MPGLKPKKKLQGPCYHWCVHCKCSIREHSLGEYRRELGRYTIVCTCGKCPGYATDQSKTMEGKEERCPRSTKK